MNLNSVESNPGWSLLFGYVLPTNTKIRIIY